MSVSSGGPHFHGDTVPSVPGAVMLDLRRMDRILRDRPAQPHRSSSSRASRIRSCRPRSPSTACASRRRCYPRADKSVVASLLERQPTLIPRYNFQLPEPLRSCGVVWGNGETMFTGEAALAPSRSRPSGRPARVQADPKGPAQTDFFRLLTGAQGSMGVVTWAAVKCELLPAAHELLFVPAGELDELVDFTYRLESGAARRRGLDRHRAYLARLLGLARRRKVEPGELPAWTLIIGLGGREHYAAERVAVAEERRCELAGEFGLTLQPSRRRRGHRAPWPPPSPAAATSPWKLAAKGACADVFFLTTLDKAPHFIEIAHIGRRRSRLSPPRTSASTSSPSTRV